MSKQICPQSESLVAYLYDEADVKEKISFERHLSSCDSCSEELTAFGFVRSSVKEWRDDLMSTIVTKPIAPLVTQERKRSALVAIREFFSLSPLWLQGATAVAAIALIALLAFVALQMFGNKNQQPTMAEKEKPSVVNPSPQLPKENDNQDEKVAHQPEKKDDTNIVDNPSPKGENKRSYKPKTNRNTETAKHQNKRRVPKQQTPRLSDEEIIGDDVAYNAVDDSLRLSSLLDKINPNNN